MTYTQGADNRTVLGVFGIPTRAEDLPSSGTATYTGEAVLAYANLNGIRFVHSSTGRSVIEADFANGTVDINSKYTTITDSNDNPVAVPVFDEIDHTGMVISGGTFTGGTSQFKSNGTNVDPVGANAVTLARGAFFGGERIGVNTRPAETAGIVVKEGDDGSVINLFIGK